MGLFGDTQHKIFHGDVIQVLQSEIPDHCIDLIFADPPYNIGKNFNGYKDSYKKFCSLKKQYGDIFTQKALSLHKSCIKINYWV